jgi:hypothetical protein
MRNLFYYNIFEYVHCPQKVQLRLIHSILVVWEVDDKLFIKEIAALRLADGRLELLIISVCLFWVFRLSHTYTHTHTHTHTRIATQELEGCELQWTKPTLSVCCYKKNFFFIILDVICFKFLDKNYLLQLFLNCETFVCFLTLPFRSKKKKWFYFIAQLAG